MRNQTQLQYNAITRISLTTNSTLNSLFSTWIFEQAIIDRILAKVSIGELWFDSKDIRVLIGEQWKNVTDTYILNNGTWESVSF